jgi:hypothetical protein
VDSHSVPFALLRLTIVYCLSEWRGVVVVSGMDNRQLRHRVGQWLSRIGAVTPMRGEHRVRLTGGDLAGSASGQPAVGLQVDGPAPGEQRQHLGDGVEGDGVHIDKQPGDG